MSAICNDLIVIGAGPAGASAAISAANAGLKVVLFDENEAAGGQVYREPVWGRASEAGPEVAAGDALRARLAASGVDCRFGHRVWFVERCFRVCAVGPEGPVDCSAPLLVVSSGAQERHRPIPGWTLPGVIGLAAATNLLKAQRILPGRRILVAGSDPLLLLVAVTILKSGGTLAGLIDVNGRADWLRALPDLAVRPDLMVRGANWYLSLLRSRTLILHRHALASIQGEAGVESATVAPLDGSATMAEIACDSVCYGFGLMPATEITRLLGLAHHYDPGRGGWFPQTQPDGSTDLPGLFICGDGAGILGAAAASIQGTLAGLAAARMAGRSAAAPAGLARKASRASRFGAAMTRLAEPPETLLASIAPDTIVCRCEGVRRVDIDAAIHGGAVTLNSLKSTTRCGMGPCGGRICEDSAAALIAAATGRSRQSVGQGTARPPLRPVPLAAICGAFDYAALPIPEAAPQ